MSARKMPVPWFRAETYNRTMVSLSERSFREGPLTPGERRLGAFVLPPFQRPAVWTREQQIRFAESAWSALPLGAYVYNKSYGSPTDGWLLDGQQRVGAMLAYFADEFPVFGYRWSELPIAERRSFEFKPFTSLETSLSSVDACREVYDRLAYGGTPHDPADRNAA